MKICSLCGKRTRKPRVRNGKVICPKCWRTRLRKLINLLVKA